MCLVSEGSLLAFFFVLCCFLVLGDTDWQVHYPDKIRVDNLLNRSKKKQQIICNFSVQIEL